MAVAAAAVVIASGVGYVAAETNESDSAQVVRVVDGDTAVFDSGSGSMTTRILSLDTPETVSPAQRRGEPPECMGPEAGRRAHELLDGQTVQLAVDETQQAQDRYGRALRTVTLPDGRDYAEVMVREGFARAYKVRGPAPTSWAALERAQGEAQAARRGVWGCPR